MKLVRFYTYKPDLGHFVDIGSIINENGELTAIHETNSELSTLYDNILSSPVTYFDDVTQGVSVYSTSKPDLWLENLHKKYNSPDLLASKVIVEE